MMPLAKAALPRGSNDSQEISPGAWQQIQELAAEKASRTPEQQKIDSQLLYARQNESW
jgi:hypothetical protein